jgi:general secretion pathway protein I
MEQAMVRSHLASHRGFTLVEVLVALAIVSIALLSALRAAGQGTANATELRMRLLAGWVAENRLAEHRARSDWLSPGIQRGAVSEAGIEFAWREEVSELPSPAFRRIDVFVYQAPESTRALAHLTGFLLYSPRVAR